MLTSLSSAANDVIIDRLVPPALMRCDTCGVANAGICRRTYCNSVRRLLQVGMLDLGPQIPTDVCSLEQSLRFADLALTGSFILILPSLTLLRF